MIRSSKLFTARKQSTLAILAAVSLQAICRAEDKTQPGTFDELVGEAGKAHSDALVVWKDGKPQGEWHFGKSAGTIEAMSATKSVVSLAIGKLITDGKIKSVDQPVHEFYPEWKQGRKKSITIKHLLNHTSGLQNVPTTDVEIYPSPDFVQLALTAELSADPGTVFSYNNKAVNLLAGIVQKASGQRMDFYLRDTLFAPLGITNFTWTLDRAGNPHAMSGLQILPGDFAKLGQLVLNRGKWNNQRLIAESWFDLSLQPSQELNPSCGLLWWLLPDHFTLIVDDEQIGKLAAKTADTNFVEKARQLKGRYEIPDAYITEMWKVFGPDWSKNPLLTNLAKRRAGKIIGCYADGYLGQYVVIIPSANLVAVRMIEGRDDYNEKTDSFPNFLQLVYKLANGNTPPASKK